MQWTRLLGVVWAGVWLVSFALAEYFARSFAGSAPDFTILGLHPSFACIVFGYWVGGVATLTVGFSRRRRLWMTIHHCRDRHQD